MSAYMDTQDFIRLGNLLESTSNKLMVAQAGDEIDSDLACNRIQQRDAMMFSLDKRMGLFDVMKFRRWIGGTGDPKTYEFQCPIGRNTKA